MKKLILLSVLCLFISIYSYSQTYSGGNGTKLNPYLISSKADIVSLINQVGYIFNDYLGKYFLLTNDIDEIITMSIGVSSYGSMPFSGIFDGNGHTIEVDINTSESYGGLFAWLDKATVKNLRVVGSVISSKEFSGGICGEAHGSTIYNCQNEADIYNSKGAFYTSGAGGICGCALNSSIISCLNKGDVISNKYSGGISGYSLGVTDISLCYAMNQIVTGDYVLSGRIVGNPSESSVIIENCYASASMLVNRIKRNNQGHSSKDGKDISAGPRCVNVVTPILLQYTINPIRWEKSADNGATWENIECTRFIYVEENPVAGTYYYRALNQDNSYSTTEIITYVSPVLSTVTISPEISEKVVGESITFTLNVNETSNNYQWYYNSNAINGAISNSYSIDAVKFTDAGNYYCVVSNQCNNVRSSIASLKVTKVSQIIDFPEIPYKTYGDLAFSLSAKTDKGLTINYQSSNPSVAKISGNIVTILKAGETNIIATQAGDLNYLAASPITRTLKVNKASQTFKLSEIPTKTYGDFPFELAATTDQGLNISYSSANTNIATIAGNKVTILKAGSTNIIANQAGNENYKSIAEVSVSLIVNKTPVKIQIMDYTKEYGEKMPEYSLWYTGLRNADTPNHFTKRPVITTLAEIMSDVGTYDLNVGDAISDNYDFNYVNGKLNITKAPLTISLKSYKILIGTPIPEFILSYSGFKGNDVPSKLESLPAVISNVNTSSPAGDYDIMLQGGGDKNYEFILQNGLLSIKNNYGTTGNLTWLIENGVLTISGTGNMPDYSYRNIGNSDIPWYDVTEYITDFVLKEGVTRIGKYSFADCVSKSITIPKSVVSIGDNAFLNCKTLNKITVKQENPPVLGNNVFQNVNVNTCVLEIPIGSTYKYMTANQWKDFRNITELEFDTSIRDYMSEAFKIYTISNKIIIEEVHHGDQIQLYSIAGFLIYDVISTSNRIEIPIPRHGVYILKINGGVIKVTV